MTNMEILIRSPKLLRKVNWLGSVTLWRAVPSSPVSYSAKAVYSANRPLEQYNRLVGEASAKPVGLFKALPTE